MKSLIKSIPASLLHIAFPQHCPVCGRPAVQFCIECVNGAGGEPLPPFCSECGGAWSEECCWNASPCYAASAHDGAARLLLLSLKYGGYRKIGTALGAVMSEKFPDAAADIIVPLPLHRKSPRPYNQTMLIAGEISRRRGIACAENALRWRSAGLHQTGKSARDRFSLSFSSFEASGSVSGKRTILVDDVYTTGATVRAAKFALERAGASVAAVFIWTRRIRGGESPDSWPEPEDIEICGTC